MSTKLYVGNMNYRAENSHLEELFSQFGNVLSARIISDRETRRSKGFGFVEMETKEAADEAIKNLNEQMWMDRKLIVNVAREKERR